MTLAAPSKLMQYVGHASFKSESPNMSIIAIDVDPQRTFSPLCPNELPVLEGDQIVDELNLQAALASKRVLTKDAHNPQAAWVVASHEQIGTPIGLPNSDIGWVRHAEVGTDGFKALPGLPEPEQYDFLVYKGVENNMHPYGACYHDLGNTISTGLLEWLTVNGAEHVLVGGLATDYCVKNTVLQLCAYNPNWTVWLNLAACRGIAAETVTSALAEMRAAGAKIVDNSHALREQLALG